MNSEKVKKNGEAEKGKRYFWRGISWILMAVLVLIVVPIGIAMFVISGLWSAADRALLKFNS